MGQKRLDGRREISVRFANDIKTMREIPSRRYFSKQELRDIYLSKEEQKKICRDIVSMVAAVMEEQNHEEHLCDVDTEEDDRMRGLELFTHRDVERTRRMKRAISAVLRRQMTGKIDEGWLLIAYRPFSKAATALAYKRGLRDQELAPSPVPRQVVMVR